jgi:anti-sigma regulatory factor (Ser/Thr protein kinase)/anti-anti-sigma regulatory factor
MDGLELVKAVRVHFPEVPVILTTAYGSEAIAVEALRQGAASYVPKSQLAETLLDVVGETIRLLRADHAQMRLLDRLAQATFRLKNNPALIGPLADLVERMIAKQGLCDSIGQLRIAIALSEAVLNAITHGNLKTAHKQAVESERKWIREKIMGLPEEEGLPSRRDPRVHIQVAVSSEEARVSIRDEGPGFDVADILGSGDPGKLLSSGGRGLALMLTLMDEVTFNEAGNEVTMVKRRMATIPSPSAEESDAHLPKIFDVKFQEEASVVVISGSVGSLLKAQVHDELETLLEELRESPVHNVVIDFAHAPHFGSTILFAIHLIYKQVSRHGGKLALCNLSDFGREVLHLAKFDTLWPVCLSRAEALQTVAQ